MSSEHLAGGGIDLLALVFFVVGCNHVPSNNQVDFVNTGVKRSLGLIWFLRLNRLAIWHRRPRKSAVGAHRKVYMFSRFLSQHWLQAADPTEAMDRFGKDHRNAYVF